MHPVSPGMYSSTSAVPYLLSTVSRARARSSCLLTKHTPAPPPTSFLGFSFVPALICRPMRTYGKHFLIIDGVDSIKRRRIMEKLLGALKREALKRRMSLSFTSVMECELDLIQLLKENGYIATLGLPLNYIDISWDTFKGYLSYLKGRSRNINKVVKREICASPIIQPLFLFKSLSAIP